MEARQIDALLAEHLFGWVRKHSQWGGILVDWSGNVMARWDEWYPSSTWDGMGQVVEAMERKHGLDGHNGFMLNVDHDGWYAEFPQPSWEYANADKPPMAAALAALKALGVEVPS